MFHLCSTIFQIYVSHLYSTYVLTVFDVCFDFLGQNWVFFGWARLMFRLCSTYVLTVLDLILRFSRPKRICLDGVWHMFRYSRPSRLSNKLIKLIKKYNKCFSVNFLRWCLIWKKTMRNNQKLYFFKVESQSFAFNFFKKLSWNCWYQNWILKISKKLRHKSSQRPAHRIQSDL